MLKVYTHLDGPSAVFGMTIFPVGDAGEVGQTADCEASSCNAAQLPRFLVLILKCDFFAFLNIG